MNSKKAKALRRLARSEPSIDKKYSYRKMKAYYKTLNKFQRTSFK